MSSKMLSGESDQVAQGGFLLSLNEKEKAIIQGNIAAKLAKISSYTDDVLPVSHS
jgi:hypothetical protein